MYWLAVRLAFVVVCVQFAAVAVLALGVVSGIGVGAVALGRAWCAAGAVAEIAVAVALAWSLAALLPAERLRDVARAAVFTRQGHDSGGLDEFAAGLRVYAHLIPAAVALGSAAVLTAIAVGAISPS